jgi:hypothetical protein
MRIILRFAEVLDTLNGSKQDCDGRLIDGVIGRVFLINFNDEMRRQR